MHHSPVAVKSALNVGKKMLKMVEEEGRSKDSDLFRHILGSSQEILAEAVRLSTPELRAQYRQVAWTELLAMPHYTLSEFVDLDDEEFWAVVYKYLPHLIEAAEVMLKAQEHP